MNEHAVNQIAAMSAAMRILLTGYETRKPDDLQIVAATGVSGETLQESMAFAASGYSTFLAIFNIDGSEATLEKVVFVVPSPRKKRMEINLGVGSFVQKDDGSFAILSNNTATPFEYAISRSGRRLIRRSVKERGNRAGMQLNGLRALFAKAAEPECRGEEFETRFALAA